MPFLDDSYNYRDIAFISIFMKDGQFHLDGFDADFTPVIKELFLSRSSAGKFARDMMPQAQVDYLGFADQPINKKRICRPGHHDWKDIEETSGGLIAAGTWECIRCHITHLEYINSSAFKDNIGYRRGAPNLTIYDGAMAEFDRSDKPDYSRVVSIVIHTENGREMVECFAPMRALVDKKEFANRESALAWAENTVPEAILRIDGIRCKDREKDRQEPFRNPLLDPTVAKIIDAFYEKVTLVDIVYSRGRWFLDGFDSAGDKKMSRDFSLLISAVSFAKNLLTQAVLLIEGEPYSKQTVDNFLERNSVPGVHRIPTYTKDPLEEIEYGVSAYPKITGCRNHREAARVDCNNCQNLVIG